jgi:lipopolysaccharide transport system ATP-binding protein
MRAALTIEKVSKQYSLGAGTQGDYRTLREVVVDAALAPLRGLWRRGSQRASARRGAPTHWSLKDVSFDVQPGEVVGVIGRNGAGKSTLLKVLSRITEPTEGRVVTRGRVGSLLEVGTGFHHELTGRENIYLNGAICGMGRREIGRKFDDIVAFSEVGPFLDTPVKRYSSGMFVRLAFAVAAHLDPEVLLVDEVLAVGDSAFQKKCLGKMGEVSRSGRTILFVSHNMATILNLCDKVAVLERGQLVFFGPAEEGIEHYLHSGTTSHQGSEVDLTEHTNRRLGCKRILSGIRLLNSAGRPASEFLSGEAVTIELQTDAPEGVAKPCFAIGVEDTFGCRLFTLATYLTDGAPQYVGPGGKLVCRLPELALAPGRYALSLNAGPLHAAWTDCVDQAVWFDVTASDYYGNGKLPDPEWGRVLVRSGWSLAGQ